MKKTFSISFGISILLLSAFQVLEFEPVQQLGSLPVASLAKK